MPVNVDKHYHTAILLLFYLASSLTHTQDDVWAQARAEKEKRSDVYQPEDSDREGRKEKHAHTHKEKNTNRYRSKKRREFVVFSGYIFDQEEKSRQLSYH